MLNYIHEDIYIRDRQLRNSRTPILQIHPSCKSTLAYWPNPLTVLKTQVASTRFPVLNILLMTFALLLLICCWISVHYLCGQVFSCFQLLWLFVFLEMFCSHFTVDKTWLLFTFYQWRGLVLQFLRAAASIVIFLYTKGIKKQTNCCGIFTVLMQQALKCVFTKSSMAKCELLIYSLTFKKKK